MKKQKPQFAKQARKAVPAYKNSSLPSARRVKDLLSRMTLEEKAAQMMCIWQQEAADAGGCGGQLRRREGEESVSQTAADWARWAGPAMPAAARTRATWRS